MAFVIVKPHPARGVLLHMRQIFPLRTVGCDSHSYLAVQLNCSIQAFYCSWPSLIKSSLMPCFFAQTDNIEPVYSGPLSQLIGSAPLTCPRFSMIVFNTRVTRAAGSDKSTSMPDASWLKSSITLKVRMLRPSANWSGMKSIDQTSLRVLRTASGSCICRTSLLHGLMR